jgi:hypothetical protein
VIYTLRDSGVRAMVSDELGSLQKRNGVLGGVGFKLIFAELCSLESIVYIGLLRTFIACVW